MKEQGRNLQGQIKEEEMGKLPGKQFRIIIVKMIHTPMDTLSLTKEARIYNGVKKISLTSGAGKIGQPLVKE